MVFDWSKYQVAAASWPAAAKLGRLSRGDLYALIDSIGAARPADTTSAKGVVVAATKSACLATLASVRGQAEAKEAKELAEAAAKKSKEDAEAAAKAKEDAEAAVKAKEDADVLAKAVAEKADKQAALDAAAAARAATATSAAKNLVASVVAESWTTLAGDARDYVYPGSLVLKWSPETLLDPFLWPAVFEVHPCTLKTDSGLRTAEAEELYQMLVQLCSAVPDEACRILRLLEDVQLCLTQETKPSRDFFCRHRARLQEARRTCGAMEQRIVARVDPFVAGQVAVRNRLEGLTLSAATRDDVAKARLDFRSLGGVVERGRGFQGRGGGGGGGGGPRHKRDRSRDRHGGSKEDRSRERSPIKCRKCGEMTHHISRHLERECKKR